MKQSEAQTQLETALKERKIAFEKDSVSFLKKAKFEDRPIYLFRYIEDGGIMRVALSGDLTVIVDDYSYQYIEGSLGQGGISSQKKNLLHQSIINYCIGKVLVNEYTGVYEKVAEIDFNDEFDRFFGDGDGKYEIYAQNCSKGKNELQYYNVTSFTRFCRDMSVESVQNLQTLALEGGQYVLVGTFKFNSFYNAEGFPEMSVPVTCEMNHGFVIEPQKNGYRVKMARRFSPAPLRWNGDHILESYMGLIAGPFPE